MASSRRASLLSKTASAEPKSDGLHPSVEPKTELFKVKTLKVHFRIDTLKAFQKGEQKQDLT